MQVLPVGPMATAVNYTGQRAKLQQLLADLPAMLAGRVPDAYGIVRRVQERLGMALLAKVKEAFEVKARGGVGSDGIRWQPLKPQTIARRRLGPADRKAVTNKARRAKLTPAQLKRFRKLAAAKAAEYRLRGHDRGRARDLAERYAESVLRGSGATLPSRYAILSARSVEILRDTGAMFRALSPTPSAKGRTLDLLPGQVVLTITEKPWHHEGNARLPARPLWPLDGDLPQGWWDYLLGEFAKAVAEAVGKAVRALR